MRSARELLFTRGFANTALRAIASDAGTSESGVLRVYGSKSGLLRAVYGSCWAEINARIDRAMQTAIKEDPDPRNLLLQLMRAVWQGFQEDPRMTTFMVSHFGFRETAGLGPTDGVESAIDEGLKEEYHRYLNRIHKLCDEVANSRPAFTQAGITPAALGHIFISIVHGIQTSWYMAWQDQDTVRPQATMDEALAVVRFFLYPEASAN
jgi:AcrR family transcriptional regulator